MTRPAGHLTPQRLTATENNLYFETILDGKNAWGPIEVNRSNGEQAAGDGNPLTLNGNTYPVGFGTHAGSDMHFSLQGTNGATCTRFTSLIGVDDEVGNRGSVVFQVYLDGMLAYDSGTMTGASPSRQVDLDLTDKRDLRLVVTDAGDGINYDHADWAMPKVHCVFSGRAIDYRFRFVPETVQAPNGETVTATLVVEDAGVDSMGAPSGPVAFQLAIRMSSLPLSIQLVEPERMYSAVNFPAQFPVKVRLNAAPGTGGLLRIEFVPNLEDFSPFFGLSHRFNLYWNVVPPQRTQLSFPLKKSVLTSR
ncbi:putative carbohydrate binding module (plasmid) [Deinococcus deserti VCD115]|uniref:Putative carbohydrate binding module n=1 Tax=Deinococcus deserti (strain DSM 17065 / CIP 109153 / LMG 22923 / VCD115) TaxID=546414 RepID=C1D272_DEIDV|nr:putative carbohydrate binding module [Deinococcus deserti VCD115]